MASTVIARGATAVDAARSRREARLGSRRLRLASLRPRRGPRAGALRGGAFLLPFAAYIGWWALGLGDLVWPLAALLIAASWIGVRDLRIPWQWTLWSIFVAWVPLSLLMNDTGGRMIGALYRYALLLAATVFGIHAHNARERLTLRAVLASMTLFLVSAAVGGYLAMALPELVIRTPMSFILPDALLENDLVRDMVVRRTTQWNPDSYTGADPRPSAPFLYANTWGNVYSLVLPLALAHLGLEVRLRSPWRWPVAVAIGASVIPAVSTLNRGMFLGLGVVAAWAGARRLASGRWREVVLGLLVLLLGAGAWAFSPSGARFFERLATTNSTDDRLSLYIETIRRALSSPVLGFGSPRPGSSPWLPALGTQGQLWTVLFSHGFVGAALFLGFFLSVSVWAWGRSDPLGAVLGGILAATLVESLFYGMMTGLVVSLVAAGLLTRGDTLESETARISTRDPRGSTRGRSARPHRSVRA